MVRWDAGAREYALSCDSVFPGMKITQTKRIGHALTLPEIDSTLDPARSFSRWKPNAWQASGSQVDACAGSIRALVIPYQRSLWLRRGVSLDQFSNFGRLVLNNVVRGTRDQTGVHMMTTVDTEPLRKDGNQFGKRRILSGSKKQLNGDSPSF